jgi:hypothetical protein
MRGAYSDQLATLAARSQELLVDFLQNDLDLAFTFLATARVEAESDAEHARAAMEKSGTKSTTGPMISKLRSPLLACTPRTPASGAPSRRLPCRRGYQPANQRSQL